MKSYLIKKVNPAAESYGRQEMSDPELQGTQEKVILQTITVKNLFERHDIPAIDVSETMWLPDAGIEMTQQICYDDCFIYVHQRAKEENIRDEERNALSQVCNDSCMEFFFDPESDGRYFNFEINPSGLMYIGFGGKRAERFRLIDKRYIERFGILTERIEGGWEAYYSIPLDFIRIFYPGYKFESGKKIRANCYKCGDKTEKMHYLAWNRLDCSEPDYHRPEDFGIMTFE